MYSINYTSEHSANGKCLFVLVESGEFAELVIFVDIALRCFGIIFLRCKCALDLSAVAIQ